MRDFGLEAQRAAQAHLDACLEALWDEDERWEQEDGRLVVDSPACAPFDGCETCQIREILFAAWPAVYASVKADFFRLLDDFIRYEATDDEGTLEGVVLLKRFRGFAMENCWSQDAIDDEEDDPSADAVDAEQKDQPQRHGDGDQTDVTGSECHVVKLPSRADGQA